MQGTLRRLRAETKGKVKNMGDLVIFSKPVIWIILSVIVIMYAVDVVICKYKAKFSARVKEIESLGEESRVRGDYYVALLSVSKYGTFSSVVAGINMALHVGMLVALLLVKATPAEMLFLIMISVACALTANRIKGEE